MLGILLSPVGKLEAAIYKLEEQMNEASPGTWEVAHHGILVGVSSPAAQVGTVIYEGEVRVADCRLIVTTHRTIDPLLAFLRDSLARLKTDVGGGAPEIHYRHPLALADAILNEVS